MISKKNVSRNNKPELDSIISVRIHPRSRKNEILEIMSDGKVKIRLTAPPVGGKANKELIRFLGKVLETASSNLEIVSGLTSREKLISVSNMDSQYINQRLRKFINTK
jgi:uncharacterized protein (TIGR00251 family)